MVQEAKRIFLKEILEMFDLKLKFSWIGIVIFILPMFINIIYVIFPATNASKEISSCNKALELVEQVTRILYAISICVLVSDKRTDFKSPWLYLSLLFLALYYIVWIRYFVGGRDIALLGKSFMFIPLPLAIFPVLYYLFASIWLHNGIAIIFIIIFGIAHNVVSYVSLYK